MKLLLSLCSLIGLSLVQSGQREFVLDLTKPHPEAVTTGQYTNCASGFSGETAKVLPLILRLESLDRRNYSVGNDVTYQVTITNTGQGEVVIPWLPSTGELRSLAPKDEVRDAFVRLRMWTDDGKSEEVGAEILQGAIGNSRSIVRLRGGDVARVTISTRLTGNTERFGSPAGKQVQFDVELSMMFDRCRWARPIATRNKVSATLLSKRTMH